MQTKYRRPGGSEPAAAPSGEAAALNPTDADKRNQRDSTPSGSDGGNATTAGTRRKRRKPFVL
jgi:hypothetical protein